MLPSSNVMRNLALLALVAAAASARAEGTSFVHARTIYADTNGVALSRPEGVACTEAGAVVVADTGNGRLVRYAFKDGATAGGTEVKLAQLPHPVRVEAEKSGSVLVLDRKEGKIGRVDAAGAFQGYLVLKGVTGPAPVPASFTLDHAGSVYVLDSVGRAVVVVDATGAFQRKVTVPPEVRSVSDLTVDSAGTIFVVDSVGHALWSAERTATALTPLVRSMSDYANFPAYITTDRGSLLVVDQHGHGIVQLGIDGAYRGRHLGMGWVDGLVYYPAQLCLTGNGEAVIADRNNNRVQVYRTR